MNRERKETHHSSNPKEERVFVDKNSRKNEEMYSRLNSDHLDTRSTKSFYSFMKDNFKIILIVAILGGILFYVYKLYLDRLEKRKNEDKNEEPSVNQDNTPRSQEVKEDRESQLQSYMVQILQRQQNMEGALSRLFSVPSIKEAYSKHYENQKIEELSRQLQEKEKELKEREEKEKELKEKSQKEEKKERPSLMEHIGPTISTLTSALPLLRDVMNDNSPDSPEELNDQLENTVKIKNIKELF
jgi:hypothetical protein